MDKSPLPILISQYFCSPFMKHQYVMSDPHGNSPSKYHHIFSRKPLHKRNTEVLSSILSIWEDYCIERLESYQWKCLWCKVIFQGIIATKALANLIGTKCMHIKRCWASINQYHLSRYNTLRLFPAEDVQ